MTEAVLVSSIFFQEKDYPIFYQMYGKRLIDVIFATILLIIFCPVFFIIAIGIKLSSSGSVFFKQERVGKDGEPFTMLKFRSMDVNHKNGHKEFVTAYINGKNKKNGINKLENDSAIFLFGRIIRFFSLDELPQLINVLKGNMSMVGPRPCTVYEWKAYNKLHKQRADILPGCTGLWQVDGRNAASFEEMIALNLHYINKVSFLWDLFIIILTPWAMFKGI